MPTYTALTVAPDADAAERLADALERLDPAPTGVGVTLIEDGSGEWEVGGYFEAPPDQAGLALAAMVFGAQDFTVSELPETDWVAHVRRTLKPVEAGRFFVHGSHDADKVPADCVPLLIEAAMAFGTGHHGTTLGCLRALDALADGPAPGRIGDIGCGTAVLAMAAAHLFPDAEILASDIDPVAVEVAEANLAANGLSGRITCLEAVGFDHPDLQAAPFDLILANILKGPLIALAPDMDRACHPGSQVILSGILNRQADEVIAVYSRFGFNLVLRDEIGDWTTLKLTKSV